MSKISSSPFKITLLGTGCPAVSTTRFGPATLVECGGLIVLVDVGSGVTQRLLAAGHNGADIDAVLITHLHSDHLVDLYQLIISSWHQSRDKPQRIFGPPGIKKLITDTMDVWKTERNWRIAFEQRTSVEAFDIDVIEFNDEKPLYDDGCIIRPVRVSHEPVDPAFGFIFEAHGVKAVISGDTKVSENLISVSDGADLLVHEVFVHGGIPVSGTRSQQGLANVASYHTLSDDVGKVANAANVKALALTHIVPPDSDREELLTAVRKFYSGPVFVGEDLMQFDLVRRRMRHGDTFCSF